MNKLNFLHKYSIMHLGISNYALLEITTHCFHLMIEYTNAFCFQLHFYWLHFNTLSDQYDIHFMIFVHIEIFFTNTQCIESCLFLS